MHSALRWPPTLMIRTPASPCAVCVRVKGMPFTEGSRARVVTVLPPCDPTRVIRPGCAAAPLPAGLRALVMLEEAPRPRRASTSYDQRTVVWPSGALFMSGLLGFRPGCTPYPIRSAGIVRRRLW